MIVVASWSPNSKEPVHGGTLVTGGILGFKPFWCTRVHPSAPLAHLGGLEVPSSNLGARSPEALQMQGFRFLL
jgi:hypothetical protein